MSEWEAVGVSEGCVGSCERSEGCVEAVSGSEDVWKL